MGTDTRHEQYKLRCFRFCVIVYQCQFLYIKVLVDYEFKVNIRPKKGNGIRWDYSLAMHNPVTV